MWMPGDTLWTRGVIDASRTTRRPANRRAVRARNACSGSCRRWTTERTSRRRARSGGALLTFPRLLRLARHERRVHTRQHDVAVDETLGHILARGQLVHHVEQHLFHDRAQPARTRPPLDRLLRDRPQRVVGELELHTVELEELLVLLHVRVLRLREDVDQRIVVEVVDVGDDGQTTHELGDQAELEQVLGEHRREQLADVLLLAGRDLGAEPDTLAPDPRLDDLVEPGERSAADEQDVRRVDLDELLVRVLAAALRRHTRLRALEDLEQRLLHALARDVARDRRVLGLARDLVDLVDVDDPGLGLLHVVVGGLDELEEDVLDVLADVAGLGERGRIRDRERDVEHLRQRLREQGLPATGRAEHHDVRLLELDLAVLRADLDALVVVVDGDRQDLLRGVLPDHVLLEERVDLLRLRQLLELELRGLRELFLDDLVAEIDALVADVHAGTGDELLDLLLRFPAERTLQQVRVADPR